jgi:hypothetical protein
MRLLSSVQTRAALPVRLKWSCTRLLPPRCRLTASRAAEAGATPTQKPALDLDAELQKQIDEILQEIDPENLVVGLRRC